MYLYVDKRQGLESVPDALMATFGKPLPVLTMILTADKTLARVKAADVMTAIDEQGVLFANAACQRALLTRHSSSTVS